MITGLIEGGRTKADKYSSDKIGQIIYSISRYWPDEADPVMSLGNGVTLELVSKSYQGTYFTR